MSSLRMLYRHKLNVPLPSKFNILGNCETNNFVITLAEYSGNMFYEKPFHAMEVRL